MSDIFISYKREDQPIARKLADALEREGWSVWWDPKLRAGDDFDRIIEAALNEARCVIVLWSEKSIASDYVRAEASEALEQKKLVPVAIETVTLPFRFKRLHTPQLLNWNGSNESEAFRKLVEDVTAKIGAPVRNTRQAPTSGEEPPAAPEQRKAKRDNVTPSLKDVLVPDLDLKDERGGTVVRWLKGVGAPVQKGEALCEVETDKVIFEIEAPTDGVLKEIKAREGEFVNFGAVVARIEYRG